MSVLSYKGYQGAFEYDEAADIFHGDVLNITDVITFRGRSIDELKAALAESIEVYLEYCAKKGKEPQKPFSGNFHVEMNPQIHQRLSMLAARDGVSFNNWVANALEKAAYGQQA